MKPRQQPSAGLSADQLLVLRERALRFLEQVNRRLDDVMPPSESASVEHRQAVFIARPTGEKGYEKR